MQRKHNESQKNDNVLSYSFAKKMLGNCEMHIPQVKQHRTKTLLIQKHHSSSLQRKWIECESYVHEEFSKLTKSE